VARYLIAAGGVAFAAFAALGWTRYSGSFFPYLLFNASIAALLALALPRPRLYGYTALVAFLTLGFWGKTLVHTLRQLDFLEPVGAFRGLPEEWDQALIAMATGVLGVVAVRAAHIWWCARARSAERTLSAPSWFLRYRRTLWALTIAVLVAVNLANLEFAFYQIGINPKLLLPARLHVLLAWSVNIGIALWIAALAWWDYQSGRRATLLMGFVEAAASSASTFSRMLFLVHAGAYCLTLVEKGRAIGLRGKFLAALLATFMLLFVASIAAVFWLRAQHYPNNADVLRNVKSEVPQLIVQRWTGLEGVLTATANTQRGPDLGWQLLTDGGKLGAESLYQRIARSRFRADAEGKFSFGTNAGPVAILLFSGSLAVVFAGMAGIMVVLAATEALTHRLTSNPFLCSLGGLALANVIVQTTFLYLTAIFVAQLWIAVAVLGALTRLSADGARAPSK
jgi:hypothetical protein